MNTEFDKQPGQRKPYLVMSGIAVAVCLFVAALMERRRTAASAEAARRARSFRAPVVLDTSPARDASPDPSTTWTPAGPSGDPVWESGDLTAAPNPWTTAPTSDDVAAEAEPFDGEHGDVSPSAGETAEAEAHVETEAGEAVVLDPEGQVEVDGWRPMPAAGEWHRVAGAVPAPAASQPAPEAELASAPNVWQPAPEAEVAAAPKLWQPAPEAEVAAAPNVWQPAPEAEVVAAPSVWQPAPEAEAAPAPDAWQPAPESQITQPAVEAESETVEAEPVADERAPSATPWFGSAAFSPAWQPPSANPPGDDATMETTPEPAAPKAESTPEPESVIELPAAPEAGAPPEDPRQLPPPRLRRWMGTGSTVLAIGLVLGAGILASGATADSTSDPATVPDVVGTTALVPGALADTTSTDTTATDPTTTAADTTTTGTTTTDTTTTDTTATTTTTTDTTTTGTTTTDTTSTSTTPVEPPPTTSTPTPPPVDPAPVDPPASDPAAAPAAPAVPDASAPADPQAPPVSTLPATPVAPTTPVTPAKPKVKAKTPKKTTQTQTATPPAKAGTSATPAVGGPASRPIAPVVTLASGADPIGSILSANSVIPAVDASLLPTPAQVSFYVKASKPLPPLPTLVRIDHPVAQRLVSAGRQGQVGWTVLAAVARLESNLGKRPGPLAGRKLPTSPSGDGLAALATFLHEHGARKNPLTPATAKKALTLYFGSTRKADRAIALAALYGALGPAGMQHGVRAETARLQRRVLKDKRVHLTVAGRSDIRHGRVDPRVLVTLEYLANSFRKLRVSDLVSGGALFSRSGSVSAHLYGRAADVASLRGRVVKGHQGPGTMTELAIRRLLLLPKSLRPRQIISLMDVDGPTGNHGSFALPDHYDRIQIDY